MKWIEAIEHRNDPLSVKEAARIYGDSTGTFYKKIRRGEIPGVFREPGKPKGRIKICPAEFAAWLRARVAAGCPTANMNASISTNTKALNGEHDELPQNGPEAKNAEKRVGKEVPRLAG
jgi:helix-turn-helix protein